MKTGSHAGTNIEWCTMGKLNKPANSISFGQYRIYLDEGTMLMNNIPKKQIDIIHHFKIGLKNPVSQNGKLVLSEVRELSPEQGNAGFFILDSICEKAVYISMSYSAEEVQMRAVDYELEFQLSSDFDASACEGNLVVIDRQNKRYRFCRPDGSSLSAKLSLEKESACFMLPEGIALITDVDKFYVIDGGKRHLIDIAEMEKRNNGGILDPEIGLKEDDEGKWLALRDRKWGAEFVMVALNGQEKFGYKFCTSGPFGSGESIEEIRK